MAKNVEPIINILMKAIQREVEAFNYYYQASDKSPSPETKSLLIQLAEEERKHRQLLVQEVQGLRSLVFPDSGAQVEKGDWVHYQLPGKLPYRRLRTVPRIDLAGISLPTSFIGGDYVDSFPLTVLTDGKEKSLGVLLYDVKGHGFDASQLKAITSKVIGEGLEPSLPTRPSLDLRRPASVVTTLNQALYDVCQNWFSFVSLFYCVLNPIAEELIYSSAGHEPPILFRDGGENPQLLSDSELLLGIDRDKVYAENKISLYPGDILILFTDGIVEATNSNDEMYGRDRIIKSLSRSHQVQAHEIVNTIIASLRTFLQGNPLEDEISLLVAKYIEG